MHTRFIIVTDDLQELVNINYKYIDYSYLCYDYENDDEPLPSLENINARDLINESNTSYTFWTREEVIENLYELYLYLLHHSDELLKNPNWRIKAMDTPIKTADVIIGIIKLLDALPVGKKVATLAFYEY